MDDVIKLTCVASKIFAKKASGGVFGRLPVKMEAGRLGVNESWA